MSDEKNKNNSNSMDATIDAFFSDIPSAPGAQRKPVAKPAEPAEKPTVARTVSAVPQMKVAAKSGTSAKPEAKQHTLTVDELRKMLEKPEKPVAKEPFWATLLIFTSMVLSFIVMVLSFVGAWWYFRGAIMSQILCVLFGIVVVIFFVSVAFMLRAIERGIREIKAKL